MPEIYVHAAVGRTIEQKRAFVKAVTEATVVHFNAPPDEVIVSIIEDELHNVAKGGVLFCDRPI